MFSVKITKIGESNSNLGNFPCHTTGPQHLSSVPFPSCSEHASWDVSSTPTASTATSVPLTSQFLSPAYTCALRSTSIHSAPYWTSLQKCRETGNSYSVCSKFSSSPKPASLSSRLWNYYALSHPNHLVVTYFFLSLFSTSSWFQTSVDATYWYLSSLSLSPNPTATILDTSGLEFWTGVFTDQPVSSPHFLPSATVLMFNARPLDGSPVLNNEVQIPQPGFRALCNPAPATGQPNDLLLPLLQPHTLVTPNCSQLSACLSFYIFVF